MKNSTFVIKEESLPADRDRFGNTIYFTRFFLEQHVGHQINDIRNFDSWQAADNFRKELCHA